VIKEAAMFILIAGVSCIIFGAGWLGIMGAMYLLGVLTTPDVVLPWYMLVLWFGPGVVTLPLGIILVIIGAVMVRKKRKEKKAMVDALDQHGVEAKARVTFVDKNYTITMNERPLYSIVEYEFTDDYGHVFTGRKDRVDSELVIRNKIEVGNEVNVIYLPRDPSINALLLADPRAMKRS
jgi:hypothetical protein